MKKLNVAAIAIFALGVGLIAGPAISAGQSNVINACVNKSTGLLRIAKKCTKSERPLSWNKEGVQGKQGLPGLQGTPGLSGPSGNSPVALAGNCFQLLNQAESLGYLWGIPANLAFFEQRTNCKVREIDLNPNSQIQGFYPSTAPHVLSQKLVSIQGGGGDGYVGDPVFGFGLRAIYEITLTKPFGQEVCSSGGEMWRVFESPVTSKTYAIGRTYGDQQKITTDIALGSGPKSLTIEVEDDYTVSNGNLQIDFESVPTHMPLGDRFTLRIKNVWFDGESLPATDYEVTGDGGLLAGLTHEPDELGFGGVYTLRANEYERGISNLSFSISGVDDIELGKVTFPVSVGVRYCNFSAFGENQEPVFGAFSNLYRVRETNPLPDFMDSINNNFEQTIGWVKWRWFERDPNDFPNEEQDSN